MFRWFVALIVCLSAVVGAHASTSARDEWVAHENGRQFRNLVLTQRDVGEQVAWLPHGVYAGTNPNCPEGLGLGDGCPGHGGLYKISNCWTGGLQGNSPWPANLGPNWVGTRPTWNVAGCDFGTGATVSKATMLANPATYDPLYKDAFGNYPHLPGCHIDADALTVSAYSVLTGAVGYWPSALNTSYKMHLALCTGVSNRVDLRNLYLGSWPSYVNNGVTIPARTAVGVMVLTGALTNITLTNVIVDNDTSVVQNNQVAFQTRVVTSLYFIGTGALTTNITLTDVTFYGNYGDVSGCCDTAIPSQIATWMGSYGNVTWSYVAFDDFVGYIGGLSSSRTLVGDPRGTFQWDHSVLNGCSQRVPAGHTECFADSSVYTTWTMSYNLFRVIPGTPVQEAFFHTATINQQTGLPNHDLHWDHNIMLSNSLGLPKNSDTIQFHLASGVMTFDAAPPSYIATGQSLTAYALTLYKQVGTDVHGWPMFQTDCGGNQSPNGFCPATQASTGMAFDASITSSVMYVDYVYGALKTNATVRAWTDGGTPPLSANPTITGQTVLDGAGNSGGVGTYTVSNSSVSAGPEWLTVSIGNGLVRVYATILSGSMVVTKVVGTIPVGAYLTGTGPTPGTVIGTQIDGDINGVGHYNVSVPFNPTVPVPDMPETSGLIAESGVYNNQTSYPTVTLTISTVSMNTFFDPYYVPMDGVSDLHDNIIDTYGMFNTAISGWASPSYCWTPSTVPTGNYVKNWVNNYDLNPNNTNWTGGLVNQYFIKGGIYPGTNC